MQSSTATLEDSWAISFLFLFLCLFVCLFSDRAWVREGQGEVRGNPKQALHCQHRASNPWTVERSWPELKSRVRCLTDWAPQVRPVWQFLFFSFFKFIYFERERMPAGEGQRGRQRIQAGSALSVQSTTWGLNPSIVRSCSELKSRVRYLIDWATQVPPIWQFLTKLNILLLCNPAIMLLGIYSHKLKTYAHTKTCTQVHSVSLMIAMTWKDSSSSRWVNKETMAHPDIKYYSALKRTELSSHEKTWRKLKCIVHVREANVKRLHTVWFQLYDILEKAKLWRQ